MRSPLNVMLTGAPDLRGPVDLKWTVVSFTKK